MLTLLNQGYGRVDVSSHTADHPIKAMGKRYGT
jgi:hypothetical protein